MKRNTFALLAAILVLGFAVSSAMAGQFQWYSEDNTVSGVGSWPASRTVLTYFSNDTNVNHTTTPFLNSYGDDIFYQAASTTDAGYYDTVSLNPDSSYDGKYLYAVVLDLSYPSFTTLENIPIGTKWGVSVMGYEAGSTDPSPLAVTGLGPPQQFAGGPVGMIPEPGSAVLLVVGAAAAFWQRRRSRR
jgi:hypothetical protein